MCLDARMEKFQGDIDKQCEPCKGRLFNKYIQIKIEYFIKAMVSQLIV